MLPSFYVTPTYERRKELKHSLELLLEIGAEYRLANDPLSFCHAYAEPADREIAAVIASSFAYGNVRSILRSLAAIFSPMGESPRSYVERFTPQRGREDFGRFRHRFNDGRDLVALLWGMRQMLEQSGSIQAFFLTGDEPDDRDIGRSLERYSAAVLSLDYREVFGGGTIPPDSYFRFLFPSPASGSACKRLCMMLRWLVRPDDGVDLGLWKGVSPDRLIMPVDTHICRIGRYLGLTGRNTADWRMAREITASLRDLDPADPLKYDFALAHIGISNGCNGKKGDGCAVCSINTLCCQSLKFDTSPPF